MWKNVEKFFYSFLVGLFSISLICSIDAAKEEIYYIYLALIECSAMVRSIIKLVKNITKKTIYEDKIENIKEELGKLGYYYDEEDERGNKR